MGYKIVYSNGDVEKPLTGEILQLAELLLETLDKRLTVALGQHICFGKGFTKLLTLSQVAELLQIQKATVRKWIQDGKLAGIKMPNNDWRFRPEFIENWLKIRTVKASSF